MIPPTTKRVDKKLLTKLLAKRPVVPPGKRGTAEITQEVIPPNKDQEVVSMRNAILRGEERCVLRVSDPFTINTLCEEDVGCWMRDSPQEVWQMAPAYRAAHGRVLCGGLGLGVLPHLLATKRGVAAVMAVERSADIADLVAPYIAARVYVSDIWAYLRSVPAGRYDVAAFDTWQATREYTWHEWVVPLRRFCRGLIPTVLCWQEEEMHGQLQMGLPKYATADDSVVVTTPGPFFYQEVFRRAARAAGIKPTWGLATLRAGDPTALLVAETEAHNDIRVGALLAEYLHGVGTDAWERKFGELWDGLQPSNTEAMCEATQEV